MLLARRVHLWHILLRLLSYYLWPSWVCMQTGVIRLTLASNDGILQYFQVGTFANVQMEGGRGLNTLTNRVTAYRGRNIDKGNSVTAKVPP